jgi:hypothetical protein
MSKDLHLNLKGCYFDDIAAKKKPFEYRLKNEYWRRRLEGRHYDNIHIKKGYPKATDTSRIITKPYRGYEEQTITHPHFGPLPVEVYAIHV